MTFVLHMSARLETCAIGNSSVTGGRVASTIGASRRSHAGGVSRVESSHSSFRGTKTSSEFDIFDVYL